MSVVPTVPAFAHHWSVGRVVAANSLKTSPAQRSILESVECSAVQWSGWGMWVSGELLRTKMEASETDSWEKIPSCLPFQPKQTQYSARFSMCKLRMWLRTRMLYDQPCITILAQRLWERSHVLGSRRCEFCSLVARVGGVSREVHWWMKKTTRLFDLYYEQKPEGIWCFTIYIFGGGLFWIGLDLVCYNLEST